MSKEAAEKFVSAWEAKDPEVIEAMKDYAQEGPISLEDLAKIAGGIGYELEAMELAEVLERRRAEMLKSIGAVEVSVGDLEQVTGGTVYDWGDPCSSDYDPNSRCTFSDYCLNMWNFYPAKDNCDSTFTVKERCTFADYCEFVILKTGCVWKELHYTY